MKVNEELIQYVTENILPYYDQLDEGHNRTHILYVIDRSILLAKQYKANLNMSYTIAAYHDLGMLTNREKHEIVSAEILAHDKFISKLFYSEQINTMSEAIREHRASYSGDIHSIYGKIVSQADRNFDIDKIICRSVQYGIKNFPEYTFEEQFKRTKDYIEKKYGKFGYAHIILPFDDDELKFKNIQKIINSDKCFFELIKKYYELITQENK